MCYKGYNSFTRKLKTCQLNTRQLKTLCYP